MEKEEELYRLHEAHLAEIALQRTHLDQLKAQHETERNAAWQEMDHQRQILVEAQEEAKGHCDICGHCSNDN